MAQFKWTTPKLEAAKDVAFDELSNADIARKAGISPAALTKWKAHPGFQARVQEHLEEYRAATRRLPIATVENRVRALNDRWEKLNRVIAERAADATMQGVPGGATGLLVRTFKPMGRGENFRVVEEYAVDTGTLKEFREHERQAAIELGQWSEKKSVSADEALPIVLKIIKSGEGGISMDDI